MMNTEVQLSFLLLKSLSSRHGGYYLKENIVQQYTYERYDTRLVHFLLGHSNFILCTFMSSCLTTCNTCVFQNRQLELNYTIISAEYETE